MSSPSARSATTGFASFRSRDFTLLIVGKLAGWGALHMTLFAIQYQVYDQTGDVANLAYIGLASFAPAIGFALITGYVADLFDRRLVIAVCYAVVLIATALFLWYTLAGISAVWPVFVILLFDGTGRAFHQPAISSLIPNLVPAETFPNAVAWHSTVSKVCQVAGPAVGGLMYIVAGPEVVYAVACVLLAAATATTLMISTRTTRGERQPTTLSALLAGLRYVYNKKIIFGAITMDLFVVLLGGVTALFPVFAKDILEVGADGAGFLRASMAAGALLSGLALTQIDLNRNVGRTMFATVFIFGGATIVFGFSELFWLSLLSMGILGGGRHDQRQYPRHVAPDRDPRRNAGPGKRGQLGVYRGIERAWRVPGGHDGGVFRRGSGGPCRRRRLRGGRRRVLEGLSAACPGSAVRRTAVRPAL